MTTATEDAFRIALLDPSRPTPEGLTDGAGRPAGRRYAVYRNNVAVSLREALEAGFPAIRSLIGAQNFATTAQMFSRQYLPDTPMMFRYGAGFPEFLETVPQLHHLGYLPDVARLELALRESYHAADAAPFDPASLADLTETRLATLHLPIAPATRVVSSPWPIHAIHRFALEPGAPKPPAHAQDVLIARPDFDPLPHLLPAGAAKMIRALLRGQPLAAAVDAAPDELDLPATLSLLVTSGALGHPKGPHQ